MHGGWESVVGGLSLVDMVVWVNRFLVPASIGGYPGDLRTAVGNHLIGIHVGRSAGSGLININREMVIELSPVDFLCGLLNESSLFRRDMAEFPVDPGSGPLDQSEGVDDAGLHRFPGDRKIQDGSLGGGPIEGFDRNWHFAHGIALKAGIAHEVRSREPLHGCK